MSLSRLQSRIETRYPNLEGLLKQVLVAMAMIECLLLGVWVALKHL